VTGPGVKSAPFSFSTASLFLAASKSPVAYASLTSAMIWAVV